MTKVCVFDDDGVVLKILTKFLEDAGYEVVAQKDSSSAFDTLKDETPDCVVTDMIMTPIDGLEIISAVRKRRELEHTAVIMISANQEKQKYWEKIAKNHGADGFLAKPFEAPALIEIIETAIASRRK